MSARETTRRLGAHGPAVVVGARTRAQLAESLGGLDVELSPDEVRRPEEAVPASAVAGARYNADAMRTLDSER